MDEINLLASKITKLKKLNETHGLSSFRFNEEGDFVEPISKCGDIYGISTRGDRKVQEKEGTMQMNVNIKVAFKDMIKVVHVDKPFKLKRTFTDSEGNECEEIINKNGMTKCVFKNEETGKVKEVISYVDENEAYDKEKGLMMCMLKYLLNKPDLYEFFDYWLEDFDKFPSSDKEVTKNLAKLNKILQKDKQRVVEDFGLENAKFFRFELTDDDNVLYTRMDFYPSFDPKLYINTATGHTGYSESKYTSSDESDWRESISEKFKEFKKLSKKYFANEYSNLKFEIIYGKKEYFVKVTYRDKEKVNKPDMGVVDEVNE